MTAGEVAALPAMTLRGAPVQLAGSGIGGPATLAEADEIGLDLDPVPLADVETTWRTPAATAGSSSCRDAGGRAQARRTRGSRNAYERSTRMLATTMNSEAEEQSVGEEAEHAPALLSDHGPPAGGVERPPGIRRWRVAGSASSRPVYGGPGERRWAMAAASSRFGAPSLRRMCETWTPAVLTLMTRAAAISRLV